MSFVSRFSHLFSDRTRDRGYEYEARVKIGHGSPGVVSAVVYGTSHYFVGVRSDGTVSCDCPYFRNGDFCKHIWAVLLVSDANGYLGNLEGNALYWADPELNPDVPDSDRPPRESWRRIIQRASTSSPRSPVQDRQLVYILDANATTSSNELSLHFGTRKRLKNGSWGTIRGRSLRTEDLSRFPDREDKVIFQILCGAREFFYAYGESRIDRFNLNEGLAQVLLPRLCATGRLFYRQRGESTPLAWDEGGPWEIALRLEEERSWSLTGRFRRGEETLELLEPSIVFAGRFFIARGKVSVYRFDGDFAWVSGLMQDGSLRVKKRELGSFLEETYRLPGSFSVELPEEIRPREIKGAMRPLFRVTSEDRFSRNLKATLLFEYGDAVVTFRDRRDRVLQKDRKSFYTRDHGAEVRAAEFVGSFGLRPVLTRLDEESDWQFVPSRLPAIVTTLIAAGWKVEADGMSYRSPGRTRISVTSGVDWFDLEGGVSYGDEVVPFPKLLAAISRREEYVKLGDGSLGLLPEEWLRKKGMVLSTAVRKKNALRFHSSQALLLDALLASEGEVSCDETFRKIRDRLGSFEGISPADPPKGFRGKLRPYQEVGLGWLHFLREFSLGGCLADDMGLGKTVQVLALLLSRRGKGRSLVVVPRSIVFNWKSEAERFTPGLRVAEYMGIGRRLEEADVVLTTYGTVRRDAHLLKDVRFDYVILDEAQAIKNGGSATAKAVRLLKADHRLAMSGTPIENHLGELWSLMEFLNPGLLGTAGFFRKFTGGEVDVEMRSTLARGLRPFLLRRTKGQVAKELPPKIEQTVHVELDQAERKRYDELRAHYRQTLLAGNGTDFPKRKFNVLEGLLRLRQAACHPGLIDEERRGESSSKLEALLEQVQEVIAEGHKALVFSQFTSLLSIVRERLDDMGIPYAYLDGRTRKREACVKRFQEDPDVPLFLISLKAGGLGLNLTAADYVFLLDPWWNPAVEAQAIDRTHRIGQKRRVIANRLVARDTVEEKVLELQKSKRALADAILQEDKSFLRALTKDDLALLLS